MRKRIKAHVKKKRGMPLYCTVFTSLTLDEIVNQRYSSFYFDADFYGYATISKGNDWMEDVVISKVLDYETRQFHYIPSGLFEIGLKPPIHSDVPYNHDDFEEMYCYSIEELTKLGECDIYV